MSDLAQYAKVAPPSAFPGLRPNMDGLVKLMILIAQDIAQYNHTGRTPEHTEADARRVLYAIFDGWKI